MPTVPDWLPGLVTVTPPDVVQVGSPDWAGTLTASQAALTVLNSVQLPGDRFLAAVSVQVRYFRYDEAEVFISIALYKILLAFWMPMPVTRGAVAGRAGRLAVGRVGALGEQVEPVVARAGRGVHLGARDASWSSSSGRPASDGLYMLRIGPLPTRLTSSPTR